MSLKNNLKIICAIGFPLVGFAAFGFTQLACSCIRADRSVQTTLDLQKIPVASKVNLERADLSTVAVNSTTTDETARVKLFDRSKDAVVKIVSGTTIGSGFIISKDGLIVTNKHVVQDERSKVVASVQITLADGTSIKANVLGASQNEDLALIKIPNQSNLKYLALAPQNSLKVGQSVYAIGSPFGIDNIFTAGVLNKIDRVQNWLYHDARINSGNSGGPLINSQGQVIGINVAIYAKNTEGGQTNTSIGIAISGDRLRSFLTAYQRKSPDFASVDNANKSEQITLLQINGKPISGVFQAGDRVDDKNIHYRQYFFEGRANQKLNIEIVGEKIDPSLELYYIPNEDTSPEKIGENKGVRDRNNTAKLSLALPGNGIYMVRVKTFQPGETGRYRIIATVK